jgi:putative ABC transport system permease protein
VNFIRLFQRIILRHLRFEWGRMLLAVAGVAIGVAVFIAIRLANSTALEAFTTSLDVVAGRANLQAISAGGNGIDERYITRLRSSRAVEAAAPVIEQYAEVDDSLELATAGGGTPLLIFGIDAFAEGKFRAYRFEGGGGSDIDTGAASSEYGLRFLTQRSAIIITDKLAGQYHLAIGDSIHLIANGKRLGFQVANIIRPQGTASALGGNFALLDIASAQEVFDRIGRLDRIDLLVPAKDREEIKAYLAEGAPAGVVIQEPQSRGAQATKMLASFDLNLTALAFIALFVAMFIIYNTMLTNTLRRRRELGIMRALGGTRPVIIALFLAEAALIGVLGAAIGLPIGIAMARVALDQVIRTVTALYILTVADHLTLDPAVLLAGAGIGIITSILSALPAAIEASGAHPRETFSVQSLETKVKLNLRRIFITTATVLAAAYGSALLGDRLRSPLLGFLSAALLLLGVAFLTPAFIRAASALFGRAIRKLFGVEGALANAYLLASLGRASTAVAALMTAIAMLIGISTMVDSFRKTVIYWMRQTINADLYMTISTNRITASTLATMPDEIVRYVDSLPAIATVDAARRLKAGYRGESIIITGARLNMPERDASLAFKGERWEDVMAALDAGGAAVSEGFALRFGKERGDTIVLATPTGNHPFTIAGVYYDYSSDAGTVMLRKGLFARVFADSTTNNLALYIPDTAMIAPVRAMIDRRFGARYSLLTYSNRSLRDDALEVFDQAFAITYALQLVAMIVAAIGVANTLAALVVERSREIGILKAVGATAGQLRKMTLVQAGLIGAASQTLGVLAGLALSAILIYVINRVSFGWTVQFTLSPSVIAGSTLLVIATAFVAGLLPAAAAARRQVAEAVSSE